MSEKKEELYVIKNLETKHFYCESKYNFCTNKKYAKVFTAEEVNIKLKDLKQYFNCEKELVTKEEAV
jgi:hypothetical protein